MNYPPEPKGILRNTAELLASIILFILFITISYGVFMDRLHLMLWALLDWILEILKPIVVIIFVFVGVFRGIPLLVSFIESFLEEHRAERESIHIWNQFESSPTPESVAPEKVLTGGIVSENKTVPIQSRGGDKITYSENEQGILTGTFPDIDYGTFDGIESGSKKAMEIYKNSPERRDRLKQINAIEEKIRQAEIKNNVNNMHKARTVNVQDTLND